MATITTGPNIDPPDRFAAAYTDLRGDTHIQFDLHPARPEAQPPGWLRAFAKWLGNALKPVGRFLDWIGSFMPDAPYARIVLWTLLVAALAWLLWTVWTWLREGQWRLPHWRRRPPSPAEAPDGDWQPEAAPAHAWLEEADAYAAAGRYADAVHHLLLRSVEDIARRRPGLIRPAFTSRDVATTEGVPPRARQLFAGIAAVVERSLFGKREVDADEWALCRSAYADFVARPAWKAQ